MAERIQGYESRDVRQQYRAPELTGQQAAVTELGRSAAALGNLAAGAQQQARVLDRIGGLAYEVGADLARQRGEQKPLPEMRDKDGVMVPLEQVPTLNIQRRAYQERAVPVWENQAELSYREETNRAWQQYNTEPDKFRQHMTEFRDKLLANAPGSIRSQLQLRLDGIGESRAFGLDQTQFARERKVRDTGITQLIDYDFRDLHGVVLRGDSAWTRDAQGNVVPHQQVIEYQDRILDRLNGLSNVNPAVIESTMRQINKDMFLATLGRRIQQIAGGSADDMEFQARMQVLEQELDAGRTEVPGFERGERATINISNLMPQDQEDVKAYFRNQSRLKKEQIQVSNAIALDRFRFGAAREAIKRIESSRVTMDQQYENIVGDYAARTGLDVHLVRAIIGAESGGNPNARARTRRKGKDAYAIGLMQLLPSTFESVMRDVKNANIYDAGDNLTAGMRFITKLVGQVRARIPVANPHHMAQLVAAGYHGGEPRLKTILDRIVAGKAQLSDPSTWGAFNEGVPGENSELKHVRNVMSFYLGSTGGGAAQVEAFRQQAMQEFGHSPRMFMQAMGYFFDDFNKAQSMREINRSLTYQPQPYDTSMARRYVEATWNRNYDVATQNDDFAFSSVMDSLPPTSPGYNQIHTEATRRKLRAIGTGNSSGGKQSQQVLSGDRSYTMSQAVAQNALLKDDQFFNQSRPDTSQSAAAVTQAMIAAADGDVARGTDAASNYLVNRWTQQTQNLTGRLPAEALTLLSRTPELIATGQVDTATGMTLSKALRELTGAPTGLMASPGSGYNRNSAITALNSIARLKGGPAHDNAPEATLRRAIEYLNQTGELIMEGDAKAKDRLHAILSGRMRDDAFAKLDSEQKSQINEAYGEIYEEAFSEHMREFARRLPNVSHVSPDIKEMVRNRAAILVDQFAADELHLTVPMAIEQLAKEGLIGGSRYTWTQGMQTQRDFRPDAPVMTSYPVEHYIPPNSVMPIEVYQHLPDEMKAGTLLGQAQKILDAQPGNLRADVEHAEGRLYFQVAKTGRYPTLLMYHKVQAAGLDQFSFEPHKAILDTKEMWDMNGRGSDVDNEYQRAYLLARAEAYGFLDPRGWDRKSLGWIADMLKGSGYADDDDVSPIDPTMGFASAMAYGLATGDPRPGMFAEPITEEVVPIAELLYRYMPARLLTGAAHETVEALRE